MILAVTFRYHGRLAHFYMIFPFRLLLLALAVPALAVTVPAASGGSVTGTVVYPDSNQPVEFMEVTLKKPDGTVVQRTATDDWQRLRGL